ncbi:MAG: TRAP transporter large permease subunit [Alphaproteobacteria bacterium]|nr:MAG: TRAP transporter large permease subunit [Alphaproteobacteria bacterium]
MELIFLILLVLLMALALGSGYPVAFALPGSAIVTVIIAAACGYFATGNPDAYFAQGGPWQWLSAGVTNLRGVYWDVNRDTLIAIPLFIFMGIMLQRSKIAEDLLVTMAQLFGPVPGGLGISVVFVGALLAATTGIVGATVVAMGLISLPAMLRNNYAKPLATGTIAASGTLGQIIPPSIVLIILADQLASATDQAGTARKALYKWATGEFSMPSSFDVVSTSAGEMFLGAFVPGLLLVGLYMVFILIVSLINPKVAPAVHGGSFDKAFFIRLALALVPPLGLIFLVLGSIIAGVATVNQAGAIGAVGAILMAGYRLREGEKHAYTPVILGLISIIGIFTVLAFFEVNVKAIHSLHDALGITFALVATGGLLISVIWSCWRTFKIDDTLKGVMIETAKTSSLVFIILMGAAMLTASFRAFGGEDLVRDFLGGLPGGFWTKFVIVMAVIFFLGFFLDFIEISVVVVPIVAPILLADPSANVTAVWLGVMIGLNIQTSFLTPPFGFALFYLRGVAPSSVKTTQIYKGVIAFILLQLTALAIVGSYPPLVNYLPNRVSLISDTAPPPRNPRLNYCVDSYISDQFDTNGAAISAAIAKAKGLNYSYLPKSLQSALMSGFDDAVKAPELMKQAWAANDTITTAARKYKPVQSDVRDVQADIRKIDGEIKDHRTEISRLYDVENPEEVKKKLESEIAVLTKEKEKLTAQIPADWKKIYGDFHKLLKNETLLRGKFRRAAQSGYGSIEDFLKTLHGNKAYTDLQSDIEKITSGVGTRPPADLVEEIEAVSKQANEVPGASAISSDLSKLRRILKDSSPEMDKAAEAAAKLAEDYKSELAWRDRAEANLMGELENYEAEIRSTIGLRNQTRFTEDQAAFVAACQSDHKDVSQNF